jgi:3D (Asp-Asp-Asp) domain-containing protein/peptidoglycan hydrolase CwlO-like protein
VGALALAALLSSSAARADDPATLRTAAEQLRAESDSLAAQARNALLDLYSLERRLARAEGRVAALRGRQAELERAQAAAERRLELARADLGEAQRRLSIRLQQLYVQGEVDPLAVLLGAESLDDALSAFDGLTRIADQDGSILRELRSARAELRGALRAVSQRRATLAGVLAEAEGQRAALAAARSEREAYIESLASRRALNAEQISRLVSQAAEASAQTPEPPAPSPAPTSTKPKSGGSPLTVDVVAYCGGVGTASGLPLGWGTVAVDPNVIPLGTKLYVPGYGPGIAADTGSAIIGKIIDIWFPTCAQARAWGRKTLTITVYW